MVGGWGVRIRKWVLRGRAGRGEVLVFEGC